MAYLGFNGFRLSIAWTRILPTGKKIDGVNEEGIQFYKDLIEELHKQGIEPFVTLFHWDVPQALEDEYGGFLNSKIIDDFRDYVNICFDRFGPDVRYWITLNEPLIFTRFGYVDGNFPPGIVEDPGKDPYTVAHNLLRAHAAAVDLYRNNYQQSQGGKIGISLICTLMVPLSDERADIEAAARASDFQFGWFMDPITFGDYPKSMQYLVKDRLPKFSPKESLMLKGSFDFLGVNYYTASYVTNAPYSPLGNYATDGCYKVLISSFCSAGVDVKGYFVWSLLDDFEWNSGYTVRFGLYYVNFKSEYLQRHPKNSAKWFRKFLAP
ncbi:isoflavonoid 7-O-beta-apiosyl-glucoside beta-glycosidase-like [Telopea speciosissima]|uniref:isoflavonoid 7-O-beta-apiosyl-glucoside beta-glycosidase-like n=1 Tax=Telopea speciosissima TaxID=54955 RepID=UPI001CC57EAA|nr:isoflavonoid 7-O-beta-apiosyl-glucoside beta-glycosidase-like [Telopea speciosissima]